MASPTPLGILERLPREIRDQIYRKVFDARYKVADSGASPDTIPILCTSSSLYSESVRVLYRQSIFRFDLSFRGATGEILMPLSNPANYPKIRTLEIVINANQLLAEIGQLHYDRVYGPSVDRSYQDPLDYFIGEVTMRDTIRLRLEKCDLAAADVAHVPSLINYIDIITLSTRLHELIQILIGFECVVIELRSHDNLPVDVFLHAVPWEKFPPYNVLQSDPARFQAYYDYFFFAIGKNLGESLGPFTIQDNKEKDTQYGRHIIFHPRKYLAVEAMKLVGATQVVWRAKSDGSKRI